MPRKEKRAKTWRDLKEFPKAEKAPLTFSKVLRSFFAYLKYSFLLALLICIGLGGYFCYKTEIFKGYLYNDSQKIKDFYFKKDKNITAQWLYKFTEISPSMPLDSIDIFEIKNRIEALGQIDEVKIEKIYPDGLKVELREKDSIAKTYKDSKLLVMSSKGDFYEPICFSQEQLAKLIELTDLKIEAQGESYIPFKNAPKIQELIFIATNSEEINFESWQKINMEKANYLVEPLMEIHTLDNIKIVFSFDNYTEQIQKLRTILSFSKKNNVELSLIDLSMKDRADLKVKEQNERE